MIFTGKIRPNCLIQVLIICVFAGSAEAICHESSVLDVCSMKKPVIPSLATRNPRRMITNKTSNWTFCDVFAIQTQKWYKSKRPMTTSCPSLFMCGTKYPIWMNGRNPDPREGLANRTSCVKDFYSCCIQTYHLTAVNCGKYMAYCFVTLPYGCHQRYCFDRCKKSKKPKRKKSRFTTELTYSSASTAPLLSSTKSNEDVQPLSLKKALDEQVRSDNYLSKEATVSINGHETESHKIKREKEAEDENITVILMACVGLLFVTVIALVAIVYRRRRFSKVSDEHVEPRIADQENYKTHSLLGVPVLSASICDVKLGNNCGIPNAESLKRVEEVKSGTGQLDTYENKKWNVKGNPDMPAYNMYQNESYYQTID